MISSASGFTTILYETETWFSSSSAKEIVAERLIEVELPSSGTTTSNLPLGISTSLVSSPSLIFCTHLILAVLLTSES